MSELDTKQFISIAMPSVLYCQDEIKTRRVLLYKEIEQESTRFKTWASDQKNQTISGLLATSTILPRWKESLALLVWTYPDLSKVTYNRCKDVLYKKYEEQDMHIILRFHCPILDMVSPVIINQQAEALAKLYVAEKVNNRLRLYFKCQLQYVSARNLSQQTKNPQSKMLGGTSKELPNISDGYRFSPQVDGFPQKRLIVPDVVSHPIWKRSEEEEKIVRTLQTTWSDRSLHPKKLLSESWLSGESARVNQEISNKLQFFTHQLETSKSQFVEHAKKAHHYTRMLHVSKELSNKIIEITRRLFIIRNWFRTDRWINHAGVDSREFAKGIQTAADWVDSKPARMSLSTLTECVKKCDENSDSKDDQTFSKLWARVLFAQARTFHWTNVLRMYNDLMSGSSSSDASLNDHKVTDMSRCAESLCKRMIELISFVPMVPEVKAVEEIRELWSTRVGSVVSSWMLYVTPDPFKKGLKTVKKEIDMITDQLQIECDAISQTLTLMHIERLRKWLSDEGFTHTNPGRTRYAFNGCKHDLEELTFIAFEKSESMPAIQWWKLVSIIILTVYCNRSL